MAVQGRFVELLDGSGTDRDEAGGKAWALDRLVEFGFAVPPALVIHAGAYRKFTAAGPIVALLEELRCGPLPSVALAGDVEAAIEDVFVSQPMPGKLVDELLPVAKGFLAQGAVAVRSSATCEDAVESSSAGQYRTFLELRTLDDVFDAIRRCWASLWFPAPRAYRRHVGIGDDGVAMAVILQKQVAAVWSGVMFTRDPQGDGGTLRIESVPGLGEGLVSGRVTPGDFLVDRRSLAVDRGRSEPPPFIEDLARLGLRVERRAGGPQDVEWSIADGRIWVLQSRPITASGSRAPHDDGFDTDAPTEDTFTSEGVAEMLPGVMAPLEWTINRPMVEDAFRRMFARLDAVAPDYDRPIIARFRGRAALNLSVIREVTASLPSGSADEVDAAYLGPDHIAAEDTESPQNRASLRVLIRNWRAQRRVEDEVRVLCTAVSCLSVIEPEPHNLAVANLLAYRRELRDLAWRGTAAELAASAAAGAAYGSLEMLLGRWLGEGAGAETAQRLTSGGLARVMVGPSRLNQIRAVLAAHPSSDLGDMLDTVPASDLRERLLAVDGRLVRAIEKEAVGFGSIASYAGATFAEDPDRLWQMVKAARKRSIPSVDTDDALNEVVDSLGSGRRWRLLRILSGQIVDLRRRLLIRMAQDAVRFLTLREEAKGALLSLGGIERRVILDGAARLVRSGHLASASDVGLLTDIEFEELLLDGEPVAAMALRRRVAALAAARDGRSLPSVFVGRPDGPPIDLVESETLTGWAASAGVVRGRVRHIRDVGDGDLLQPGEIIVAVSTDPSWTPLFMAAGGIVLERGGPLSHAAIVARELQLPAVLNVADAVRRLADGVLVEVDGRRGVVSVVAETPNEVEAMT